MSDLLRKWLRDDLGVKAACGSFEQDLASGYLLGEIFYRCNLQPDFEKFVDRTHPDAMINNFTRLQPTVTKLGIPFDSKVANRIMTEEKGVATSFLYQLKTVLDSLHKDLHGSKTTGKFANTLTVPTTMSRAALEAQRSQTMRAVYDAKAHQQFEENLRARSKPPNQIMESMHLRAFEDEARRQIDQANYEEVMDYTMTMGRRENYRVGRLDLMRSQRQEKAEAEEAQAADHRASQAYNRALEKKELQIELAVAENKARKQRAKTQAAGQDALEGIDAFEKTLKRLGCDEGGSDGLEGGGLPEVGKTPLEHLARIKSQLPSPALMAQEGNKYLEHLHVKKVEDTAARKERERRRRRVLLEQQRNQQEGEEKQREEALLAALSRNSRQEQYVAERLHQLKQEKQVMRENREFREEQYRLRREQDYADALAREAELAASMKAQYAEAAEREAARWRESERARGEQRRRERASMVAEVTREIISLAVRCTEYRESTDALVPRKEYREWVSLFVKGVPLDPSLLNASGGPAEPEETQMVLDKATVTDYLASKGEWEVSQPIGLNDPLGSIVDELMRITLKDPVPAELPDLYYPVKLSVLGQPFSGKTTMAQRLTEEQGLKLIDPEVLVREAVAAAEAADEAAKDSKPAPETEESIFADNSASPDHPRSEPHEDSSKPEAQAVPTKVVLGRRARESLQKGEAVDNDVLVGLVVEAMVELGATHVEDAPVPPEVKGKEDKARKSDKKADKKADKSAVTQPADSGPGEAVPAVLPEPRGFLLDGFPRTAKQAVLLEQRLTGLDLERRAEIARKASVLAPPPKDPTSELPLVSGLDKVMVFELAEEAVALRRALGRRVDPRNNRIYHMEFDPPPEKDAGLMERLQESLGPYNDSAQAQERLAAAAAEFPAIDEWLLRFDNLRVAVQAEGTPQQVYPEAAKVAQEVLSAKQKALETSLAARAATLAAEQSEQAARSALEAKEAAQAAAASLLAVKKAEVEAAEMLAADDDDDAAKEMLASKTAEQVAAELLKAKQAMKGAEEAAAVAAQRAGEAAAEKESAEASATATYAAVEAKAAAEHAFKQAKEAAEAAQEAASGAKQAAAAAAAALEQAEKTANMGKEELFPVAETRAPTPPVPEQSGEEQLVVPPFTTVPHTLACILYSRWGLLESSFLQGLKRAFHDLRMERRVALEHFAKVKRTFLAYLRRPDSKQKALTTFQLEYNAVDADLRRLPEAKGELLLRAEELRDALWDTCDVKLEENEAEVFNATAPTWVQDHSLLLAQHFAKLVQLEADCFTAAKHLLLDYYTAKCGFEPLPRTTAEESTALVDVKDWGVSPAAAVGGGDAGVASGGEGKKDKDKKDKKEEKKPPKGKDEQASELPEWMQPLQEAAPDLVTTFQAALALMPTPGTESPRTAGEKKGAEVGKKGVSAEELEAAAEEAARLEKRRKIVEMAAEAVTQRNVDIFERRLVRLAQRAAVYLAELNEAAQTTKSQLEEWTLARYQNECSAVAAAVAVIRKAAACETELPHDMQLQGEDLVEEVASLALAPDVPPPPPPEVEPDPALGVLSCNQLQLVAHHFQSVAPHGLFALEEAVTLLARVGAEEAGQGLPPMWTTASTAKLHDVLQAFDPNGSGFVDWRELFMAFAAVAFPKLPNANFLQLGETLKEFKRVDEDGDGLLSLDELLKTKCWFQLAYRSGYNRFDMLKRALFTAFATHNEATNDMRVNYETMMLYICTDSTMEGGVEKAFHVVARYGGNKAGAPLSWEGLEKVMYPLGRELALNVGRATPSNVTQSYRYSGTALQELVEHVAQASGVAADNNGSYYITAKQLLAFPSGKEIADKMLQRYCLKKLNV